MTKKLFQITGLINSIVIQIIQSPCHINTNGSDSFHTVVFFLTSSKKLRKHKKLIFFNRRNTFSGHRIKIDCYNLNSLLIFIRFGIDLQFCGANQHHQSIFFIVPILSHRFIDFNYFYKFSNSKRKHTFCLVIK